MAKVLTQIRASALNGTVRIEVSDGMDLGVVCLSGEAARNLIYDLEEAAGVADLENEEWKAEREADAVSTSARTSDE